MTAQISPNRMEVSDRFPMLGFAVRTSQPDVEAEVVIATDISLFSAQNRQLRNAANFYTSREHGTLRVPRGDGVFVVPPEVLARFIGNEKLYFGLATGSGGAGGLQVDALPREGSPYVSLRGFTGRTLRRGFGALRPTAPKLDWAGDQPRPGSEAAPAASTPAPAAASPAQPVPYDDGFGPMPEIPARESGHAAAPANRQEAPAAGMVFGEEDMRKARNLARDFTDLFQWTVPQAVIDQITPRGFAVQRIVDAAGDLNLDFYKVRIDRFPEGWDAPRLLEHFITHINDFVDTDNTSFAPYGPQDVAKLASPDKVGAVFNLNIVGPDDAAVVISSKQGQFYSVSTIRTPDTGDHPVSGHRQFGYILEGGVATFYTRGADRSTAPVPGTEWLIWQGAEALWRSFQQKLAAWINANGGSATILPPFSERFNATAVRLTYGHFDVAQAFGDVEQETAKDTLVRPAMPGDARARATRIGGEFAPQIHRALDSGLEEAALQRLLDTLDPPATAAPLGMTADPDGEHHAAPAADPRLAPPPPPQVRELGATEIAGIAIEVINSSSGDITTNLANWPGIKHPRDTAPRREAAYQSGEVVLRDWPMVGGTFGIDDIYAWLRIRWQFNGTSLGRIYIDDIGHDDAVGWGLTVTTTIEDDSRLYRRSSQARAAGPDQVPALHININYVFDETIVPDHIANTRVSLFADGTHAVESRWVQHERPGGGTPTNVVRPFETA